MIEPFKGELMLHPCALDYNANTCSNRCAYCFAQCRKAVRSSNPRALVDLCCGRSKATGLTRKLFDAGLPVNVSNRTDPLAASNQTDSRVAFSALSIVRNGVLVQTKGARSGDPLRTLDALQKDNVALYVTITTPDDGVLAKVEPGAGDYAQRLALVDYARSRGWAAIVGLNPLHAQYMGSLSAFERVLDDCTARGANDFLVQPLHISRFAAENMSGDAKRRCGDTARDDGWLRSAFSILRARSRAGLLRWQLTFFNAGGSHALDAARARLGNAMLSTQEFVNFAAESPRRLFTSRDFLRCVLNPALAGISGPTISGYLFCYSRNAWKSDARAKSADNFEKVYRAIWNNRRFWPSPLNVGGGKRFVPVANDDGSPLLDDFGCLTVAKCDYDWNATPGKPITLTELAGKGVKTDEER